MLSFRSTWGSLGSPFSMMLVILFLRFSVPASVEMYRLGFAGHCPTLD